MQDPEPIFTLDSETMKETINNYEGISAGIGGQIGVEYTFPGIPLQLAIDCRPMWLFGNFGPYWGYAGAVRYVF